MPYTFASQDNLQQDPLGVPNVSGIPEQTEGGSKQDTMGFGGIVGDIAMAPLRGLEGFGKSTYDLIDWATLDALPDSYEGRILGQSKTFAGGLIEGITQFSAGFALAPLKPLKGASTLVNFLRASGRGAIADFVSFDPHEARLSNLLQSFPVLQNPVFDYLEASEEDSQAEGRFKNALEGLALGGITEALFLGTKALKPRSLGKNDEELVKVGQEATQRILSKKTADEHAKAIADRQTRLNREDLTMRSLGDATFNGDVNHRAFVDLSDEAKEALTIDLTERSFTFAGPPSKQQKGYLDDAARATLLRVEDMFRKDIPGTRVVGEEAGAVWDNIVDSIKTTDDIRYVIGELPKFVKADGLKLDDIQGAAHRTFLAALAKDKKSATVIDSAIKMAQKGNREAFEFVKQGMVVQDLTVALSKSVADAAKKWSQSATNEDAIAFQGLANMWFNLHHVWSEHKYFSGLGLRAINRDPADGLNVFIDSAMARRNFSKEATRRDLLDEKNLTSVRDAIIALDADASKSLLDPADIAGRMSKVIMNSQGGKKHAFVGSLEAAYKNLLLTNPATNVVNLVGNTVSAITHTTERWTGARAKQLGALVGGDTADVKMYGLMAQSATRELRGYLTYAMDAVRAGRVAWDQGGKGNIVNTSKVDERWHRGDFDPQAVRTPIEKMDEESTFQVARRISSEIKAGTLNNLWPWLSTPGRLLGSVDEAFKTGQYKAAVDAQLWLLGKEQGLKGVELEDYVSGRLEDMLIGGDKAFSQKAFRERAIDVVDAEVRGGTKYSEAERIARIDELHREFDPWIQAEETFKRDRVRDPHGAEEAYKGRMAELESMQGISDEAIRRSLEATFQTRHGQHDVVEMLIKFQRNNPRFGAVSGFVLPFVRTPYNVARFSLQRLFPVDGFKESLKDVPKIPKLLTAQRDLAAGIDKVHSSDPRVAQKGVEAVGRLVTSASLLGVTGMLVSHGNITGAAPKDKRERELWLAAGKQEFSVRVGDKYISYKRVEPFSTVMGVMADMMEAKGRADVDPSEDVFEALSGALAVSLASNVTDKTFFSGLSAFLECIATGDEFKIQRVMSNLASPFVTPPGVAAMNRVYSEDGTLREVRSVADSILSKMPGTSKGLDPRRNVLGEILRYDMGPADIINPFYHATRKNDPILEEMLTFGTGVDLPVTRLTPEVDLKDWRTEDGSRSLADKRNEMVGTIRVGGKTLRQALRDVMQTAKYQSLSNVGPTGDFRDPRSVVFSNIISKYRSAANKQILRENKELMDAYQSSKKLKRSLEAGRISTRIAYNFMNPEG